MQLDFIPEGGEQKLTFTSFRGSECNVVCQWQRLVASASEVVCRSLVEYDDACQCLVGSDTEGESSDGD